jgi:hypothetical protein
MTSGVNANPLLVRRTPVVEPWDTSSGPVRFDNFRKWHIADMPRWPKDGRFGSGSGSSRPAGLRPDLWGSPPNLWQESLLPDWKSQSDRMLMPAGSALNIYVCSSSLDIDSIVSAVSLPPFGSAGEVGCCWLPRSYDTCRFQSLSMCRSRSRRRFGGSRCSRVLAGGGRGLEKRRRWCQSYAPI